MSSFIFSRQYILVLYICPNISWFHFITIEYSRMTIYHPKRHHRNYWFMRLNRRVKLADDWWHFLGSYPNPSAGCCPGASSAEPRPSLASSLPTIRSSWTPSGYARRWKRLAASSCCKYPIGILTYVTWWRTKAFADMPSSFSLFGRCDWHIFPAFFCNILHNQVKVDTMTIYSFCFYEPCYVNEVAWFDAHTVLFFPIKVVRGWEEVFFK